MARIYKSNKHVFSSNASSECFHGQKIFGELKAWTQETNKNQQLRQVVDVC